MTSRSDQPAFPTLADNGHAMNQDGMTLRDYFAAKAMQAFCSRPESDDWLQNEIAADAYNMADAMLKARDAAQ